MSVQIIKRENGKEAVKETISRIREDAPQIAYNSEGRITVRIPKYNGDVLMVFDRPLSRELIRFIKNYITETPQHQTWCAKCAKKLDDELPF